MSEVVGTRVTAPYDKCPPTTTPSNNNKLKQSPLVDDRPTPKDTMQLKPAQSSTPPQQSSSPSDIIDAKLYNVSRILCINTIFVI